MPMTNANILPDECVITRLDRCDIEASFVVVEKERKEYKNIKGIK